MASGKEEVHKEEKSDLVARYKCVITIVLQIIEV